MTHRRVPPPPPPRFPAATKVQAKAGPRVIAPPPVRFPGLAAIQAKPASRVVAPPPVRFPAAGGMPPKLTVQPTPQRGAPVVQRSIALAFSSAASTAPTGARSAFRPEVLTYMYKGPGGRRAKLGDILQHDQSWDMELHRCNECRKYYPQEGINIDHINPWDTVKATATTRGEEIDIYNDIRNLQILCTSCNLSKQQNLAWHYGGEYREGLSGPEETSVSDQQRQIISTMLSGKFVSGTHIKF